MFVPTVLITWSQNPVGCGVPRPVPYPLLYEYRTRRVAVCPVLSSTPYYMSTEPGGFLCILFYLQHDYRARGLLPAPLYTLHAYRVQGLLFGPFCPPVPHYMLTEPGRFLCPLPSSPLLHHYIARGFLCAPFCPPVLSAHTTLLPCSCAGRDPCLPTTTTLERVLPTNQTESPAISGHQLIA